MAGSEDSNNDEPAEDEVANVQSESDDSNDDSARGSSDVTWGASDFEAASDVWANEFHSDATYSDGAEPFYELDR